MLGLKARSYTVVVGSVELEATGEPAWKARRSCSGRSRTTSASGSPAHAAPPASTR